MGLTAAIWGLEQIVHDLHEGGMPVPHLQRLTGILDHLLEERDRTKFDLFAAAALTGLMPALMRNVEDFNEAAEATRKTPHAFMAVSAYNYAEAMLAERERRKG